MTPNTELTEVDVVFPAEVRHLIPDNIPTNYPNERLWLRFQSDWFYKGLPGASFYMNDGIDGEQAIRHLSCIQSSFQPKHEVKCAAVAYLASLWFRNVRYEDGTYLIPETETKASEGTTKDLDPLYSDYPRLTKL